MDQSVCDEPLSVNCTGGLRVAGANTPAAGELDSSSGIYAGG
jgi:hypothetical protein